MAQVVNSQFEDWAEIVDREIPLESLVPFVEEIASSEDKTMTLKEDLLCIQGKYESLIEFLDKFSMEEDGIKFNIKLKQFEEMLINMCPDEVQLEAAFSSLRAAALRSVSTARRLTAVGVSLSRRQHQQHLRTAFLNTVLQDTFNKMELFHGDPTYLINAANLMGDYFAEARLSNGGTMAMLGAPLIKYLRALLAAGEPGTYRALAMQLIRNGRDLLPIVPKDLDELAVSIRLQLLKKSSDRAWLLLCADMCSLHFRPLPKPLENFYSSQLDLGTENTSESTESRKPTDSASTEIHVMFSTTTEGSNQDLGRKVVVGSGGRNKRPSALSIRRITALKERLKVKSWRENLDTDLLAGSGVSELGPATSAN